jgi:hypothetical protein
VTRQLLAMYVGGVLKAEITGGGLAVRLLLAAARA